MPHWDWGLCGCSDVSWIDSKFQNYQQFHIAQVLFGLSVWDCIIFGINGLVATTKTEAISSSQYFGRLNIDLKGTRSPLALVVGWQRLTILHLSSCLLVLWWSDEPSLGINWAERWSYLFSFVLGIQIIHYKLSKFSTLTRRPRGSKW